MLVDLSINFWSVVVVGLVAGYLMYFADLYLQGFGGLFGMFPRKDWWWMMTHQADSIIFSGVYAAWLYPVLPGDAWFRGALFGVIVWLAVSILTAIAGAGGVQMFKQKMSGKMVFSSLLLHVFWGLVLGALYRV